MKAESYTEREVELAGWPAHLITYRLGDSWFCKVDNVSPGAQIARAKGDSRAEAETLALEKAQKRLAGMRRMAVGKA